MTLIGAQSLKELSKKDLRILIGIEVGMIHSQYVEVEEIAKIAKLSIDETTRWLKKCHKLKLVHRWTGHFVGYELTIHGYDALALNALYEKGVVTSIGREKGVGKEAKVFYALDGSDNEIVLKLHRVGFTSFHQVKKKRRYTANKRHISELYSSRLSAETEFKWLKIANKINLNVPKVYHINRHVISMELIHGVDLHKLNKISDPQNILDQILDFMDIAWNSGKFVHGDLSEHNIILNEEYQAIVIDFPQSIENNFENSLELLTRDITNVLTYFSRKHGLSYDRELILKEIVREVDL